MGLCTHRLEEGQEGARLVLLLPTKLKETAKAVYKKRDELSYDCSGNLI